MSFPESTCEEELVAFYRRQALLAVMQELSEECWDVSWHPSLERDLYRIVFESAHPEYGMGWITATDRKNMRHWAVLSDSWFIWSDAQEQAIRIPLSEAKSRFRGIVTHDVPDGMRVHEAKALYELSSRDDWELEPFVERDLPNVPFLQWLNRARETYRFTTDRSLYLVRRHDGQFVLGYGPCQVDLVQPKWLPSEGFLRADNCSENNPCKRLQLCCACAEEAGIDGH